MTSNATATKFAVELRKIDDIRPYERNPRLNDQAVDAVAASLAEFGFRQPIVVDAEGVIVAGHTRWKAAKQLGLAKVPVHVATDLTAEQVRAYRLADNRTGELAEWDLEILPIELNELREGGFDMDILAFDEEELGKLLSSAAGVNEGLTDPDSIPEPDILAPLEERPLGGVGLFLMRKVMSQVHFDFDPQEGNTLTMIKKW